EPHPIEGKLILRQWSVNSDHLNRSSRCRSLILRERREWFGVCAWRNRERSQWTEQTDHAAVPFTSESPPPARCSRNSATVKSPSGSGSPFSKVRGSSP